MAIAVDQKSLRDHSAGFAAVAAPEFLRIGVGTGLSILANVVVDKAGMVCCDFLFCCTPQEITSMLRCYGIPCKESGGQCA